MSLIDDQPNNSNIQQPSSAPQQGQPADTPQALTPADPALSSTITMGEDLSGSSVIKKGK